MSSFSFLTILHHHNGYHFLWKAPPPSSSTGLRTVISVFPLIVLLARSELCLQRLLALKITIHAFRGKHRHLIYIIHYVRRCLYSYFQFRKSIALTSFIFHIKIYSFGDLFTYTDLLIYRLRFRLSGLGLYLATYFMSVILLDAKGAYPRIKRVCETELGIIS
ncbi:unnamed protein product [Lactuca virosa]|uniref:Uncharacterized protein n=1 Tax=Lactuca virosa TaxID=75947 RepID=A0AAU9PKU6_9ASTR|nr:unnamed protein product [Lactuca virosa]